MRALSPQILDLPLWISIVCINWHIHLSGPKLPYSIIIRHQEFKKWKCKKTLKCSDHNENISDSPSYEKLFKTRQLNSYPWVSMPIWVIATAMRKSYYCQSGSSAYRPLMAIFLPSDTFVAKTMMSSCGLNFANDQLVEVIISLTLGGL
jgi:hypothetical protein